MHSFLVCRFSIPTSKKAIIERILILYHAHESWQKRRNPKSKFCFSSTVHGRPVSCIWTLFTRSTRDAIAHCRSRIEVILYEKKRGAWEKIWTQVENGEGNSVLGEIVRPVLTKVRHAMWNARYLLVWWWGL